MESFQELQITVSNADYRSHALHILAAIRPQWNKEGICISEMARDLTGNVLLECSDSDKSSDDDNQEKVIIRVFGDFPTHRDSEVRIMRKLSEKGIIAPVYCSFKNGMAYRYATGKPLKREQLYDDSILRAIAIKMHSVHQLDVTDSCEQSGRTAHSSFSQVTRNLHYKLQMPDFTGDEQKLRRYDECLPSKTQLDTFMQEFDECFIELASRCPTVFCHMDVHEQNIIYNSKSGGITLVDWESCGMCLELVDLAVLLVRTPNVGVFTDVGSMKHWLQVTFID